MRLFHAITAVQLLAARLVAAVPLDSTSTPTIDIDPSIDPLDALAQLQQHAYDTLEQNEVVSKRAPNGCSLANTSIRRDWHVHYTHEFALADLTKGVHEQARP
jgi:tyrosinase